MINSDLLKIGGSEFRHTFKNQNRNYGSTTVIVVGCGGTGGRIIPNLAQHIANHNHEIESNPRNTENLKHLMRMILIDMDTVEGKNLKRQNFFAFDVGRGKAEVMAERYSALYGLHIEHFNKPFADCDLKQGRNEHGYYDSNFIIFDCTDNVKARKSIEAFDVAANTLLISCGNEDNFGQVLVSTIDQRQNRSKAFFDALYAIQNNIARNLRSVEGINKHKMNVKMLPTLLELHPNFKDTEKPSCTEMVLQNDQSMPINMLVAQLAYNVFYDIVSGKPLNYNMVRCNINNTFSTEYISSPYALKDLFIKGIFGVVTDEAVELIDELVANNGFLRISGPEIIAKSNKHGILKYGLLSMWHDYCSTGYRQPGFADVAAEMASARVQLENYLNGGSDATVSA